MCMICEKKCVRRAMVGQRTDPHYYMVKYSRQGLEQVTRR